MLDSQCEDPLRLCRDFDRNEEVGRVQVIFSRIVNDSDEPFLISARVSNHLIDLASLQVFAIAVLDAKDKLNN